MTEEGGSGTRYVCPVCGTRRGVGGRYCPGCGLDYWHLAAGRGVEAPPAGAVPPASESAPAPSPAVGPSEGARRLPGTPRTRLLLGGLVTVVGLLLVAALVMRPAGPIASPPRPSAFPTVAPPSPDLVVGAFFNAVRDPGAAFEVKVSGLITKTIGAKRTQGSISGDLRIVGDRWSGALKVAQPDSPAFNGSIARIGERSWTRVPGAAWRAGPLPAGSATLNPFAWISTVDQLTYLRAEPVQVGRWTHHLETTKWLSGTDYDAIVLELTDPQRDSSMEVVTTDDGVPLSATYRFSIRGTLRGGAGSLVLTGSTSFTFLRWGESITISPPA